MSLCRRRYISLGLPYSFERVPCAEDVATMLLRSPIAQAAQVRQGQDGHGVLGARCQAPTAGSAAGADTGVAVRGCPGPARQPHAGAGAVPGAAGQGCASTVSGVQVGAGSSGVLHEHPPVLSLPTGCCGTRRMATHWPVWRQRLTSSRTAPTGSSSTWGSPGGMGQASRTPSAHSGPGLCQPQGDCWPWEPRQDHRQMEQM